MNPAEQHEVVIVGAGPVGLSLTLGLAREGVDVLVLEKETSTAEHSRAPAIWPGTQEILSQFGVLERFAARGLLKSHIELWDVDRRRSLLQLPIKELGDETPWPRLLILPQSQTERLLYEAIRDETAAEVRFASEAVGFSQDAAAVDVTYLSGGRKARVRARFLAGCDGAHSTMRGQIGAELEGITYRTRAALADIRITSDEDFRSPRLTTRPRLAVAIRIDEHLWRLILPFDQDDSERPTDERVEKALGNLFPPVAWEPGWKSEFSLHRRVSTSWVDGRVVLAGDAAHLNSPVGGEGMNAGIADAAALKTALQEALAADCVEPLEVYAKRRRKDVETGVNRFTDLVTRLLFAGGGGLIRPGMRGASIMLRIPPVRRRVLRRLAMLT